MKKLIMGLLILGLLFPLIVYAEEKVDKENESILIENSVSGVLMEASTGQIIYEKEKDKQVAVASMTKMVAQIIILENIEKGNIKWDDKVKISTTAAEMGGSQIYLEAGEEMSIKDLFKGVSMASANDAVVQLAEVISGNEEKFVKVMNEKVKELGLKNTNFVNCTGLDVENHYSSAYDMAVIARELLKHKDILDYSSVYEDYLREDTENKFWLVNTNKLVRFYDGADGLKTGHTDAAKYCIAATAKRDKMRLIAIVLGEEESKVRNSETMALLDYGFNNKKVNVLKKQGDVIKKVNVNKGTKDTVDLISEYDVAILEDKTAQKNKYKLETKVDNIKLPVKKGDILGKISIKQDNNVITTSNLVCKSNVDKLSFWNVYSTALRNIIIGKVN